jgi:hypothetical protein
MTSPIWPVASTTSPQRAIASQVHARPRVSKPAGASSSARTTSVMEAPEYIVPAPPGAMSLQRTRRTRASRESSSVVRSEGASMCHTS